MKFSNHLDFVCAAVSAVSFCVLTGCGDQDRHVASAANGNAGVLVTVDGKDFTEKMLETEIAINMKLMRLGNPNVSMSTLSKRENQLRKIAVKRFVDREAILAEAKRRGLSVSDAELADIHDRFTRSVTGKKGGLKYEDILAKLTPAEADSLGESLAGDMLYQKTHAVLAEESKVVPTKDEADRIYANYLKYRASAEEEERKIFRQATNVWKMIVSGQDFGEVGSAVANAHTKYEEDWGTYELSYFKDDVQFCKLLSGMSAGDITPPVLADNGLLIAKVIKVNAPTFEKGSVAPTYQLSEIFFELPEKVETSSREDFFRQYTEEMSKSKLAETIAALKARCKVDYHGTNSKEKRK